MHACAEAVPAPQGAATRQSPIIELSDHAHVFVKATTFAF
jgi:hypothetical protein